MYMNSNEPYQRASRASMIGEGAVWGAIQGGVVGGAYSGFNQYMLKGSTAKMSKLDPHIGKFAEGWREAEKSGRAYDKAFNHGSGANPLKQKSPLARFSYNSAFGHGLKGNSVRVGASMALGGIFGALHNASNGVVR